VCDGYDALVSSRVYRPAWPAHRAFALLAEESELAFDSRCVAALARVHDHEHALRLAS
jgi:HD-GYP domain-containing protein (c-di-GMP phosphodiesterase class II)